jgi:hypothetical protein
MRGQTGGFEVGVLVEDEIADDRHKTTRAAFLLNEDSERARAARNAKSSGDWEGFARLPRAQRFGRYNERRP